MLCLSPVLFQPVFTIHFFNTHFRPDKFPMDLAIFTGRVSFEEMKYDKPREYENLIADNKLECSIATPFPPSYEKAIRIFALAALIIGLTLIGLIMYAMVLGHR